jgi:hypothetical protein
MYKRENPPNDPSSATAELKTSENLSVLDKPVGNPAVRWSAWLDHVSFPTLNNLLCDLPNQTTEK